MTRSEIAAQFEAVYPRLRQAARRLLGRFRRGGTLHATALVHEAYLRIAGGSRTIWNGATHFRRAAVAAMRSALLDRGRARRRLKRGGDHSAVMLTDGVGRYESAGAASEGNLARALARLADVDGRAARIVELRFIDGYTEVETASILGLSRRTVQKECAHARAWLLKAMEEEHLH